MLPRDSSFSHTDWSMVGRLHGDEEAAATALERLVRRYWTSIFAYVRRLGHDAEESSDLTQGFVTDIILNRRLLHRADRSRGRLRNFLITSLENYLREQHRHATRLRRTPGARAMGSLASIDDPPPGDSVTTPEAAFEQAWCRTLVQSVLRRVEEECERDGLSLHWQLFEARVVNPIMRGSEPIEYSVLARQFELPGAVHAVNLVVTVKRRFVRAMRGEIEATVFGPDEVDGELLEIISMLETR